MARITKYKPEYCELLIKEMSEGLSYDAVCGVIEVSRRTIYDWEAVHPEWLEAKEIAFEKSRVFWEKLGIKYIVNRAQSEFQGGSRSRSLNASVWIFNMKNRFGWRDKQPGEEDKAVTHKGEVKIERPDIEDRIKQVRSKK